MSLFNIGWDHGFLWSGTVGSLSAQAVFPLTARLGMNADPRETALRLKEIPGYREELPEVMKGLVTNPDVISSASILAPLEFFVATIMSPEAPFDRWVAGDKNALTEEQKRGFDLFTGKAGCSDCHYGWRFSDGNIYDIGLKIDEKDELALDLSIALTKAVGLRNIADRPPYTHRGDLATLEQVIDFYDRGGDENRPTKSDKIRKLGLSIEEKRQLVQFLRSLSGPMPPVTIPMLPR